MMLVKLNRNSHRLLLSSSSSLQLSLPSSFPLYSPSIPIRRSYLTEIQQGLYSFHSLTGLPWWMSIMASTVIVKSTLLPLVRFQLISSGKLAQSLPEISQLTGMLTNSILKNPSLSISDKIKGIGLVYKASKAILTINDTPIYPILMYPLMNITMFISFIFAVRGILDDDLYGELGMGGDYWFRDLVYRDETYILPTIAVASSYFVTEMSFRNAVGKYILLWKDMIQCSILLFTPITTSLPSGVFFYWIPSSLFALLQGILIRHPRVMKLLKIPGPVNRGFKLPKD